MPNAETQMNLDEAVAEVLGLLTGLDLEYDPNEDRYQAIVRMLNRALRANALEKEWSYYSDLESVGPAIQGEREVVLRSSVRPRIVSDDSVRLCDSNDLPVFWAYFLPRDALHKYVGRSGLWCSVVRDRLQFSRPFYRREHGLDIQVPVMREPRMFRLPADPEDEVPDELRAQLVDFWYPDLIVLRAAYMYAQSDPVMQPRVQTIEAQMKDLMYQIIERDDRFTDSPEQNTFLVPIQNSIYEDATFHRHPLADERR